jgi:hypothetical protein
MVKIWKLLHVTSFITIKSQLAALHGAAHTKCPIYLAFCQACMFRIRVREANDNEFKSGIPTTLVGPILKRFVASYDKEMRDAFEE